MSDTDKQLPDNYAAQALKEGLFAVLVAVMCYGGILLLCYGGIQLLKGAFSS